MKSLLKVLTFAAFLAVLLATPTPKTVYAASACVEEDGGTCTLKGWCETVKEPVGGYNWTGGRGCAIGFGCCVPKPNCDCSGDPECGAGMTCDEGGSAGCTLFNGKEGLCKPSGGSKGGGGTLPPPEGEIDLGLFKISTDPAKMAEGFLEVGITIGTLLAILFIIIGGYGIATSGGNSDNLEKAKKQISAAVAGLLFILMSVLILNIIGVEVMGIPFSF